MAFKFQSMEKMILYPIKSKKSKLSIRTVTINDLHTIWHEINPIHTGGGGLEAPRTLAYAPTNPYCSVITDIVVL